VRWVRADGDAEPFSDARETVAPPTVAERDGDRDDVRPLPARDAIEIAHELREEVVRE